MGVGGKGEKWVDFRFYMKMSMRLRGELFVFYICV